MGSEEPAIVGYGRSVMELFSQKELRDALLRAFRDRRADYIVLDSNPHGQRFLAAAVAYGIDQGWLYCSHSYDDGQDIASAFRLTSDGAISESTD